MIYGLLPPVGQRVRLSPQSTPVLPAFDGCAPLLLNSGTAALALALTVARKHAGVDDPVVLLPAYACPDLVAAAHYAGVRAVLVDCEREFHGFDLAALRNAMNVQVVAVVAVNLLGVRERLTAIRSILKAQSAKALLVEDNAQYWPEDIAGAEAHGDVILTSFGRGKPVNLLGGAALWCSRSLQALLADGYAPTQCSGSALFPVKVRLFNALLQPLVYQLASALPFLHVGETRFHPLEAVCDIGDDRRRIVNVNVAARREASRDRETQIAEMLQGCGAIDLALSAPNGSGRLLRYPLLCPDAQRRDEWIGRFVNAGIGATAMYKVALQHIDGVADMLGSGAHCPGAEGFASRLITLPLHEGVTERHLQVMGAVLSRI